ncbi:hypothetical protein GGX14DRAFT_404019 [Mycena pura]|uniref:Alpha-type protein kinase domain-containing protein n=1 Tax=Mycena pura TaxID=153505 RepID=A0AAD6UWN3_9AGAR|nr:hypothetical protein GGX14DRAFT_404019 [Mycena pura]
MVLQVESAGAVQLGGVFKAQTQSGVGDYMVVAVQVATSYNTTTIRRITAQAQPRVKLRTVSQGAPASATMTICRAYLVEEFMPWGNGEFMKFVQNGNTVPLLDEDYPLYNLAQFLRFTQHVQYEKSGGLGFISDYQGTSTLLTDPQIMSSPCILFPPPAIKTEEGDDPFGEGCFAPLDNETKFLCKLPQFNQMPVSGTQNNQSDGLKDNASMTFARLT